MTYSQVVAIAGLAWGLALAPAHAQSTQRASTAIQADTDRREHGLSWSDGKPSLSVATTIPATYDLAVDVEALTLRDSARHGGADVGLIVAPRYALNDGPFILSVGARGNVFVGRSGMSYVEATADVEHTLGPARLIVGAAFAPSQKAIGGSNLHLDADLSAGIPGVPLTLYGGAGFTTGSSRDEPKAWRLRPGGSYADWRIGAEHTGDLLSVGVRYSDTSIGRADVDPLSPYFDRHYGSRIVAYLRFTP